MDASNDYSLELSSSDKVIIKLINDEPAISFDDSAAIFAINWFNLKSNFVYNLYGLLATKYVIKVSGKLFFKGNLIQQLDGDPTNCRKNLLIVSYPSPKHFLKLVSYKFFQFISIFRVFAVKQFCFAFSKNIYSITTIEKKTFTKEQIYLVHHFKGDKTGLMNNFDQLASTATEFSVKPFFCGVAYANLVRESSGVQRPVEFPMDGMILFSADSTKQLETFIACEAFQQFKNNNAENSSYLYSRTL